MHNLTYAEVSCETGVIKYTSRPSSIISDKPAIIQRRSDQETHQEKSKQRGVGQNILQPRGKSSMPLKIFKSFRSLCQLVF